MLYIELQDSSLEWNFSEEQPFDNIEDIIDDVKWIKADGYERDMIINWFSREIKCLDKDENFFMSVISTIPLNRKYPQFQCFYGDIARTILLTLGTI